MNKSNDVKIYYTVIDGQDDGNWHERAYKLLDDSIVCRAKEIKSAHQRSLNIAGKLLVLYALRQWGGEKNHVHMPKMFYGSGGKPFFPLDYTDKRFEFNISHSGDVVVCATSDEAVGVDVEKVKKANISLAKRFFDKTEYEKITASTNEKKDDLFYKYWTCKESFIKATGEGLKRGLNSFVIDMENQDKILIDDEEKYECASFDMDGDYKLAVCKRRMGEVCLIRVNISEILS